MGRAFEFRKARKMKRWAAMSKAFTRIGKDIVIAVKEGLRPRKQFQTARCNSKCKSRKHAQRQY